MNVIARLEYELTNYNSAVHRFNHYTTRIHPQQNECLFGIISDIFSKHTIWFRISSLLYLKLHDFRYFIFKPEARDPKTKSSISYVYTAQCLFRLKNQTIFFCQYSKVKLATVVEGALYASFSIATVPRCRRRARLLFLDCSTLPLVHTLKGWVLSKDASSTIFWVFSMTRPRIEPRSSGPLANTNRLANGPVSGQVSANSLSFLLSRFLRNTKLCKYHFLNLRYDSTRDWTSIS